MHLSDDNYLISPLVTLVSVSGPRVCNKLPVFLR